MPSKDRDEAERAVAVVVERATQGFLTRVLSAVLAALRAGRVDSQQPIIPLGVMLGWWTDAVSDRVVTSIRDAWQESFSVNAGGSEVTTARADAMSFHLAAVKDRLSRSALPEIPEAAFEQVRLSQSAAALGGWDTEAQARDIAERLAWEPDKSYWKAMRLKAEQEIDAILDPLGRPGTAARTYAHQNDPAVKFWQTVREHAVDRIHEDEAVWSVRATRIARTESTAAWNSGALAALASEGRTHKKWVATKDPRTRESHREANGQIVPLGRPFRVGESALRMPGDPAAPPWETVNCRCTIVGADEPGATTLRSEPPAHTFFRAEGPHDERGYAGRVDERTGRYFGTLERALRYLTPDRHLYEVTLTDDEMLTVTGNPEDHLLLTPAQAARRVHSPRCPNDGPAPVTASALLVLPESLSLFPPGSWQAREDAACLMSLSLTAAGVGGEAWRDQLRVPRGNGKRSGRWTWTPWKHLDDITSVLNSLGPVASDASRAKVAEAHGLLSPFDPNDFDVRDEALHDASVKVRDLLDGIGPTGDESLDDAIAEAVRGLDEYNDTDWTLFAEATDIGSNDGAGRATLNIWDGPVPSDEAVNPDLADRTSQWLVDELLRIKNHPVQPSPTARKKRAAYLKELSDRRDRDAANRQPDVPSPTPPLTEDNSKYLPEDQRRLEEPVLWGLPVGAVAPSYQLGRLQRQTWLALTDEQRVEANWYMRTQPGTAADALHHARIGPPWPDPSKPDVPTPDDPNRHVHQDFIDEAVANKTLFDVVQRGRVQPGGPWHVLNGVRNGYIRVVGADSVPLDVERGDLVPVAPTPDEPLDPIDIRAMLTDARIGEVVKVGGYQVMPWQGQGSTRTYRVRKDDGRDPTPAEWPYEGTLYTGSQSVAEMIAYGSRKSDVPGVPTDVRPGHWGTATARDLRSGDYVRGWGVVVAPGYRNSKTPNGRVSLDFVTTDGDLVTEQVSPSTRLDAYLRMGTPPSPVEVRSALIKGDGPGTLEQIGNDTPVTAKVGQILNKWVGLRGSGELTEDERRDLRMEILHNGEKAPAELWRGANMTDVAALKRRGQPLDFGPVSSSGDAGSAMAYADNGDGTPVLFRFIGGPKALHVADRAEQVEGYAEDEWITSGRFYVHGAEMDDGQLVVTLSQRLLRDSESQRNGVKPAISMDDYHVPEQPPDPTLDSVMADVRAAMSKTTGSLSGDNAQELQNLYTSVLNDASSMDRTSTDWRDHVLAEADRLDRLADTLATDVDGALEAPLKKAAADLRLVADKPHRDALAQNKVRHKTYPDKATSIARLLDTKESQPSEGRKLLQNLIADMRGQLSEESYNGTFPPDDDLQRKGDAILSQLWNALERPSGEKDFDIALARLVDAAWKRPADDPWRDSVDALSTPSRAALFAPERVDPRHALAIKDLRETESQDVLVDTLQRLQELAWSENRANIGPGYGVDGHLRDAMLAARGNDADGFAQAIDRVRSILNNQYAVQGEHWKEYRDVLQEVNFKWYDRLLKQQGKAEEDIRARYGKIPARATTPEAVIAEIGMFYKTRAHNRNCVLASYAYELRRRGIDAVPKQAKEGRNSEAAGSVWFNLTYGDFPKVEGLKGRQAPARYKIVVKHIKDRYPPGSRGAIRSSWKGRRSGHIWNWERDARGRVVFYDAQTGQVIGADREDYWREIEWSSTNTVRLDDRILKSDVEVILVGKEYLKGLTPELRAFAAEYQRISKQASEMWKQAVAHDKVKPPRFDPRYETWEAEMTRSAKARGDLYSKQAQMRQDPRYLKLKQIGDGVPFLDPDQNRMRAT